MTPSNLPRLLLLLLLLLLALATAGCASPDFEFRNLRLIDTRYDADTASTAVTVEFELWRGDEQVADLPDECFRAIEDGVPATSESMSRAEAVELRRPVILLLDTSLSLYKAEAITELKKAATEFRDELGSAGFEMSVVAFNTSVEALSSIDDIPETREEPGTTRWTSLYFAVQQAARGKDDALLVLFSDGADNYSQNHGVDSLEELCQELDERGTTIHAIGFGAVDREYDRAGVPAETALRRMSSHGSYRSADAGALDAAFDELARTILRSYCFVYRSPNSAGLHQLQIRAERGEESGESSKIDFPGMAPLSQVRESRALLGHTLDGGFVFGIPADGVRADVVAQFGEYPSLYQGDWIYDFGMVSFEEDAISYISIRHPDESEPLSAFLDLPREVVLGILEDRRLEPNSSPDLVSAVDLPHFGGVSFSFAEGVCDRVLVHFD